MRALWSSAWPKALYGASVTSLGRNHIQALGSGALRGLNARRPGANPLLHLSLLEFLLADPGYFALRTSVQDVVRYGSVTVAQPESFPAHVATSQGFSQASCSRLLGRKSLRWLLHCASRWPPIRRSASGLTASEWFLGSAGLFLVLEFAPATAMPTFGSKPLTRWLLLNSTSKMGW